MNPESNYGFRNIVNSTALADQLIDETLLTSFIQNFPDDYQMLGERGWREFSLTR
jgi:hypothetical protein